jgi:hypothetical protein
VSAEVKRATGRWGRGLTASLPRSVDLAIAIFVLLLLTAPALFTRDGFVDDWVNHMWLTWMESREVTATGHPSLFLNAEPLGVFYPNYAFYGGTLYGLGGYLMALTGAPVAVFVAMLVGAFAAAYGGTIWAARQAGVRGLASHLPAIVVVSSAYYLSLAYGRGSWPELVATSMIPLMVGSGLRIMLRGSSFGAILALACATTLWSGSHNISLVWGAIFLAGIFACLLLAWLALPSDRQLRRLGVALGAIVLGVMINGWFLWPDVAFAVHTEAAQIQAIDPAISGMFSRLSVVFDPLRERATRSTYLRSHFTEVPVLVILWLLGSAALLWRGAWSTRLRRLLILLGAMLGVLLLLLVDEPLWQKLPSKLSVIQFTFRLETYIAMAIAALVIVVLRAMRGRVDALAQRTLGPSLVCIVIFGLGLGVWQVWNSDAHYFPTSPHYLSNRSSVLHYPHHTPPTWYDPGQFRDASDQVVPTEGSVSLNPALIKGESTTQTVSIPPGEGPLASNIAASVNLVSIQGLRVAGRTSKGFLALDRPVNGSPLVSLTVRRADTLPMRFGPWLSLLGALGLIAALAASVWLPRRRRRDSPGVAARAIAAKRW